MTIKTLTRPQVRQLYAERMTEDFPNDELKPLSVIEQELDADQYACYGCFEGGEILAYAFFAERDDQALVDYYAVRKDLRGKGIGSAFIRGIIDGPARAYDCALLEVDDPDLAAEAQEHEKRNRRLRFYLQNGLVETGVRAEVFHVGYRILALPVGGAKDAASVAREYSEIYRATLPPKLYDKMVKIETT